MEKYQQGIKNEKSALENFAVRNHRNIKIRLVLICLMEKQNIDKRKTVIIQDGAYFRSETYINLEATDVKQLLSRMTYEILTKISIYQNNGSGWYFNEVLSLEIHTVDYKPMKGSSYIPLPDFIVKNKAIVNIQNRDQKCFLWCILHYLRPVKTHNGRVAD